MFEPESLEEFFEWSLIYPARRSEIDWNPYGSYHSELLGYFRWCKLKREGKL